MNRKELINLAKENGVAKAHQTKTVVLEELLTEMGLIGNKVEKRGRKVDPNSVRQIRLKALEEKRANGTCQRGRPVDSNSVRQLELNRKQFNNENGVELRGRKVDPNSVRQIRLREMEEKRANGKLKRGRPKKEVIIEILDVSNK